MMTRRALTVAAALAGAALLASGTDASAQAHRYGAGWTAGGTYLTELNADAAEGTTLLDPGLGFTLGLHLDRWFGDGGRIGLRYQGSYQQPRFHWTEGQRKIDVVSGDVSLLLRLLDPSGEDAIVPYLALGAGGLWYDLGRGRSLTFAGADAFHDGEARLLPLVAFGLGVDVPAMWDWDRSPVRIRLEVADHMTFGSPLLRASDRERHGPVHHVRFTLGLYSAVGPLR